MQVTLKVPTSANVAVACRLSEESDTVSKSTSRILDMPLGYQNQARSR